MAPPLIVRAVLDAAGYLKVSESVVSSNTAMAETALGMGADFTKSAQAQVAAGAKVIASQRAQLTNLKAIQAEAVAGSDRRIAADVAVAKAQAALNRSMGLTAVSTGLAAKEAQTAERDLGKLTRGALAGSGVFAKLGRSLAFASTGFILVAGGSTALAESVRKAEDLAAAQRQVDRQLQTSGKSWATYGTRIDSVLLKEGHLAGFTRAQLLQAFGYLLRVGGNVQRSLHLTGLAADVARGRSISLQAASIALSKALGGSATALRRLGIIVPNNVTKLQALEYVQKKFAGQAEAGTTTSERFSAALSDAGATVGTAVLPTFDRLVTRFGNWIQRMNESGKLTKDVDSAIHVLGIGFHGLGAAISTVDKITGGFGHTLLVIGEIWAGIKIVGWISTLKKLAVTWGLVGAAATEAGAAEAAASTGSVGRIGLGARLGGLGIAGRFGLGAGLAIGGQVLGGFVGREIPGQAGRTAGSTLRFAGLGAGIGSLLGPEGAVAGAGIGALAGAVSSLIHSGPSFTTQMVNMATGVTELGKAAKQSKVDILGLQAQIAGGRVDRTAAQQTLRQAQAQEKASRGTSQHADAVAKLAQAQYNLAQINQTLSANQQSLNNKQAEAARIDRERRQGIAQLIKQVQTQAQVSRVTPATAPGLIQAGFPAPRGLKERELDTFVLGLQKVEAQLQKQDPEMSKFVKNLIDISQLFKGTPNKKTLRLLLQETITRSFTAPRLGPGGDIFPTGPRSVQQSTQGGAQGTPPVVQWTKFQLTLTEQILQAKAALTKTTTDDVAVAKQIIARIKRLIARGKLDDNALLQALQAEADAQSTIQAAADARKQAAQAAAAAAKARASTYNVPAALQLAQAKAEAYGKSETAILHKIIAAAQRAINAGGKNWRGLVAAYQVIANARAQLEQDAQAAIIPLKLQLQLARAQALGTDQTPILKKMKAALVKALKAAKGNIQRQIDIWNQIAAINQQLGQNVQNAYGDYKKASLKWETEGLGLTPAQRRALEARLSQIGPGGTHPMSGTGAAGYIIDPETGRPIHRGRTQGSKYTGGGGGGKPQVVNANIDLRVYIDGKQVEATVTKRQQRNAQKRPTQRRGPNAATR